MKRLLGTALLLIAIVGSMAVPVKRSTQRQPCATHCTGNQNVYNFAVGKTYEYDIESSQSIIADSRREQTIGQKAKIKIAQISPCEFSLQVESISVEGASVPDTFSADVSRNPLRFSFDDGKIESLCPSDDEETWVLNLKRSMLSSLQNAFEREGENYETDVSGKCRTDYTLTESGNELQYGKRKNLRSCRGHHGLHGAIRAHAYDVKSDVQSSPFANAEHSCTHQVTKAGILKEATCTESYSVKPFSKESEGEIKSTTRTHIKLIKESDSVSDSWFPSSVSKVHSLEFDHTEERQLISSEAKREAADVLQSICKSNDRVLKETPTQFTDLVNKLRRMESAALKAMLTEAETSPKCTSHMRFLLDALPMCGTEQCVKLMVEQIQSSSVLSDTDKQSWYASLAFVPHVTEEMVMHVSKIVPDLDGKGLLGIGSMVHTYCRQVKRCDEEPIVESLMQKLISKLNDDCTTPDRAEDIEKMVVTLKSIGNIGHISSAIAPLKRCFEKESNPTEIRISAVQAMRRMPCDENKKNSLLDLYANQDEDIEVRISSFLSVIRCASDDVIDRVNDVLEDEKSNQVGSYVWSFLHEKRKTTNPADSELRSVLRREPIRRRFDRHPSKFSRFSEMGTFSNGLNAGMHTETSMVYSPGSYLARSMSYNLTAHLFGHSVNLFEVGARQEGLDHVMDKLFGPEGMIMSPNNYYFNKDKKNMADDKHKKITKQLQERDNYKNAKELMVSFYLKVFGDEIAYFGINERDAMEAIEKRFDSKSVLEFLSKNRELKLAKNFLFLDTTKTIPTVTGLPLRLSIVGATSIDMKMSGKVDLTKVFKQPHDLEVHSSMKPSSTIEITTTMAIQTPYVKVGYTQKARLHTSMATETEITLKDGKVFKSVIRVPQDRIDIFDIEVQSYQQVGDQMAEIVPQDVTTKMAPSCSGETFARLFGWKACIQYSNARQRHVLPSYRANVFFEKTDKQLESYELTVEMNQNGYFYPKLFVFNTPGSEVDREMRLHIDADEEVTTVDIRTPMKELKFEGKMKSTPSDESTKGELTMTVDGKDKYEMTAEFKPEVKGSTRNYQIDATYQAPDSDKVVTTTAYLENDMSKRFVELFGKVDGIEDKPYEVKVKGSLAKWNRDEKDLLLEYSLSSPDSDSSSTLKIKHTDEGCDAKFEYNHEFSDANEPFNVRLEYKSDVEREGSSTKISRSIECVKTLHPESNFQLTTTTSFEQHKFDVESTLKYGRALSKNAHMHLKWHRESTHKYLIDAKAKMPEYEVDHKAKLLLDSDLPSKLHMKADIDRPGTSDDINIEVKFHQPEGSLYEMNLDASLKGIREMRFKKDLKETEKNKYKSTTLIQWDADKKAEIDADVIMKFEGYNNYESKVDAVAKISGVDEPYKFHKHAKSHNSKLRYSAAFKKGERSLYDLKMDLDMTDPKKTTFDVNVDSEMMTFDYQLTGSNIEDGNTQKFESSLKSKGKDSARVELYFPLSMAQGEEKHFRTAVLWSMDTKSPKELTGEYKLEPLANDGRKHQIIAKSQLNGENYKWEATITRDDYYTMNNTFTKNNQQVAEISWAKLHDNRKLVADFVYKTFHPLKKRHVTGQAVIDFTGNVKIFTELKCHMSEKRAIVDVEVNYDTPTPGRHETKALIELGTFRFSQKTEAGLDQARKRVKSEDEIEFQWAEDKKITNKRKMDVTLDGASVFFTEKTTFPFKTLSEVEYTYDQKCNFNSDAKKCAANFGLQWNKKKDMSIDVTFDMKNGVDFLMSIVPPSKNKVQLKLVGNGSPKKIEREFELKWNTDDKIGLRLLSETKSHHQYENQLHWEAKIKDTCDMKAHLESKVDGDKVNSELTFKRNDDLYKFASDADLKAGTGVAKIQTPMKEMKSGKLELKKVGEDKYEITTERNGADGAVITGEVHHHGSHHHRKAQISITNIDQPISVDVELKTDDKRKLKFIVKYENDDLSYGVDIGQVNEQTGDMIIQGIQATIVHPEREPQMKLITITAGDSANAEAHFIANKKVSTEPTILGVGTTTRHRDADYELYLKDPRLTHPIKLMATQSILDDPRRVELKLKYSDLESKTMKAAFELRESPTTIEVLLQHDVSNLMMKFYYIDNTKEASDRKYVLGAEYKAKNELKKHEMTFQRGTKGTSIQYTSPKVNGKLGLEHVNVQNTPEYRVLWFENNQEKPNWVVAWKYDEQNMRAMIELRKAANGQVILHMSDGFVSDEEMATRVWHKKNSKRVDDIHGRLWLDKADLIKYHLSVRPEAWKDVIDTIRTFGESNMLKNIDTNADDSHVLTSYVASIKIIREELRDHMQPMNNYWETERTQISEQYGIGNLLDYLKEFCDSFSEFTDAKMAAGESFLSDLAESSKATLKEMSENLQEASAGFKKLVVESMTPFGDIFEALKDLLRSIADQLTEWNTEISEFIKNNEVFQQIAGVMEEMSKQINRIVEKSDIESVSRAANKYMADLEQQYGNIIEYIRDYFDWAMEYSSVRGFYQSLQPMLDEIATVDVRDMIQQLFDYLKSISEGKTLQKYMPRVTIYKPSEGEFELELPLPMKVKSLRDIFYQIEPEKFAQWVDKISNQMNKIFSNKGPVSDEVWNTKGLRHPVSNPQESHKSTAFVINDGRHTNVITFDGHSYRVDRSCEMLLAKDILSQQFSLTGNFAKSAHSSHLKNVNFQYKKTNIEVTTSGKVMVNGDERELPFQVMDEFEGQSIVSVKRTERGIKIKTFDGINIKFDWFYSQLTVTLPQYYYGHSAGLLGSNDNEHFNDLMLASGQANDDLGQFFDSYKIGSNCQVHQIDQTEAESDKCTELFRERSSPLRSCFRRVSPRPFFEMCSADNKCNVTAAYVAACKEVDLDVIMPEQCLTCTAPNARIRRSHHHHRRSADGFTGGMSKRIDGTIVKNADIVFVVMEQPCMKFAHESINKVAEKIETQMNDFNSIRYGVIGYHGVGVHNKPHFHTGNHELNFDKQGLRKAVEHLAMDDAMEMADSQDPLKAINFAALNYPFRATSVKSVVLWTCGSCGSQFNYYDVQSELLQRGIQLHVMSSERIETTESSEAELLGFDATRMFTTSGINTELRESLSSPHDACTVLAQETNGTVWTVADQESSIIATPGELIGQRAHERHAQVSCFDCECDSSDNAPKTVCYPCEIPTPVSLTSSSFFNIPYVQLRNTFRKAQKTMTSVDAWMI